jgi:hypothetical protein
MFAQETESYNTEPFSEEDFIKTKSILKKAKNGYWIMACILVSLIWIMPFYSEEGIDPLIYKYPYFTALLKYMPFYLLGWLIPAISYYFLIVRKIQLDLKKGMKISMQTYILLLRYYNPNYCIRVTNKNCNFYIAVELKDYKKYKKGNFIRISILPKSRRTIEINKID